jgi:hypothetical protein
MCLNWPLFGAANLYNRSTTRTPIICHFGKIVHFISQAMERGYAKGSEGR